MLKRGQDPRKFLEGHRERGPKQITITYEDIAQLADMSPTALRMAISRGRIDPESLESIFDFIAERRGLIQERRSTLRNLVHEARALTGLEGNEE